MEIELADAVTAIRDELLEAAQRAAGKTLAFTVGPIEMEFAVELKKDAKAKAGFKAWVLTGDIEAGVARATTQKVKVTLTPKRHDGRELLIAGDPDDRPSVAVSESRIGR
jgi:hypothetical protein